MATIYYEITDGTGPFTVSITPSVAADQHPLFPGTYFFSDIPDGDYMLTIDNGCNTVTIYTEVDCITTTTTTTVCNVDVELVTVCDNIEEATTTTTTTTVFYPTVECLDGMTLEFIYLDRITDLALLPPVYTHPCESVIMTHFCNLALYEVYGNNVYIGDSRMNNLDGVGGGPTDHSGNLICQDYYNRPMFYQGQAWTGSDKARYDSITISYAQALAIANANNGGTMIHFSFAPAVETYNGSCDGRFSSHKNVTWVRISSPIDMVLYNGCPEGDFLDIDVCTGEIPTTTTTTTILEIP